LIFAISFNLAIRRTFQTTKCHQSSPQAY